MEKLYLFSAIVKVKPQSLDEHNEETGFHHRNPDVKGFKIIFDNDESIWVFEEDKDKLMREFTGEEEKYLSEEYHINPIF